MLLDRNKDKTTRFSPPAPSQLVAQLRHRMPAPDSPFSQASPLNFAEVSICGELMRLARTFFERKAD
jgi:hypothetical protein